MKGTGNFVKEFFGGLFVLLCFAFGLTACEVGLGGAIDTSDPRAGVTSPSIDGVVGGSVIHLEGSCEDDTGVAEVRIVRLYEKDGLVDYSNLGNATLSADGRSWTLDFTQSPTSESLYIFNGQELYLPDGTYHINVLPVDVGGRIPKNDAGRSFKIDNTPPIFLITSPSSKNIEDPSPYGKTIKVKGNIYDTSDGMSDVTVSIYNTSGTQIDIQKTSDMTTGLGTKDKEPFEVLIARQNAQDDAIASSNYTALYPPSNGNNKYYMEIKLKDMANSDNDLPGNEASIVYFRAPLFEKLKRELGVSSLSGSDLMRGYNGTHSSFTSEQCNKIKRILDGTYDDDTSYYAKVSNSNSTRLAFSVDPNNTPKYSFGGMTYESGTNPTEWSGRGAAGGSISISVMAGSDEYLVDPSTLKVYIQAVTESGSNIGSRREVTVRKEDGSELGSTGTDSATYIVTLPDDLSDTYYKLSASGKGYSINETTGVRTDIDMVPAKNPGGYGFVLFSNKIPVTITSEADQSYVRKVDSNKYSFAIKISDPNNPTSINRSTGKIKYQIKAEQGYKTKQEFTSASWNGVQINSIEGSTLEGPVSGLFSKTISNLDFTVNDDSVGTIALRIWGDNGVESDKNVYLLYVDNKKPTITVNNNSELTGSALITERSSNYVAADGEYRLSGTWQDEDGSGVKILKYSTDGNTWTDIGTEYTSRITDVQSWSVQIPVEEGAGKKIYLKAIDLVGNEYDLPPYENIKFDFSDPVFTTVPTVTKDDYVTSGRTFTAVAIDSFGLDTITAVATRNNNGSISTVNSGTTGYNFEVTNTAGADTSKTATITMNPLNASGSDGVWEITLTAKDKNDRTATTTFGFTVDNTAPAIKNNSVKIQDLAYSLDAWQKLPTAKVTGTITEAISLDSVYYLVKKADETPLSDPTDITGMAGVQSVSYTNRSGDVNFSISVDGLKDNSTHGNIVYIQPVDKAGNKGSVGSYTINVDQLAPSLAALKYKIGSGTASEATGTVAVNTQTLTLWGTYTDACSGVNALGFEIGSASVTPTSIEYTTENVTASNIDSLADSAWTAYNAANAKTIKGWKATFESNKFANGTIKVSGTDVAGNSTTVSSITLRKDNVKPTVSNVSIEGAYRKTDTVYYVNNSTTQIKVKGVSADDYALNNTVITIPELASSPITLTGTSWATDNLNIAGLTGSSVTITVVSHDTAGNESNPTSITLNFDTTAPSRKKNVNTRSMTLDWGSANNWEDSEFGIGSGHYYAESYSGSTSLQISGSFDEDGSGVSAVYYELVNGTTDLSLNGSNYATKGTLIVPNADGSFGVTLSGLQEGSNKLRVIAVDNVGNWSKITDSTDKYESDFVLGLDQTAPAFGNGFALDGSDEYVTGTSNFTISGGTVSDDRAGVDPSTIQFWFVNKNNPSTKYTITRTAGTYGQLTYTQTDPTDSNLSGDVSITVTPDTWFTEANLGTSPILYGSMLDYSNPKNNSGTVTILTTIKLDQTAPAIAIDSNLNTTPITDENDGGKIKKVGNDYFYELTGTWSDANGSGTDKLYYSINNGTTWIDVDTLTTKNYAKSKAESSWSLYIPVEEGTSYNFAVKAEDAAGNTKEAKPNKTVTFDFTKPTITVDTDSGIYGGTRPQVTVTANDHYQIKATDGITLVSATKNGGTATQGTDYTLSAIAGGGTATATRVVTFSRDGVYEFTFKATDANGRDSDTITRTWTVDTEAPSPKADNDATYGLKVNGAAAKTWYRDTNLRFDGYVTEEISGLSKVYYLVSASDTADDADVLAGSQWNFAGSVNTGTVAYSVTPTVGDGTSYVHMIFEDAAGNQSEVKTSTVKLDQDVPTISGKFYTYNGVTGEMPSSLFVNTGKSDTLTLYGLVNETGSGIDTLTLTKSGDTFSPTITYATGLTSTSTVTNFENATWGNTKDGATAWKATFNVNGLTTGAIQAAVSDLAGNGSTVQLVSLDSDATAPTLTLTNSDLQTAPYGISERSPYMTVEDGHHNYTFQGTWSDSGSGTYKLYYSTDSTTIGSGTWNAVESTSAPQSTGTTNWTQTLELDEGTGKQIAFYAEDKVGNKTSVISRTGITIDYTDPTLTLSPANAETYYPLESTNTAVWTITASDNLGTPAVTVAAMKDGSAVSSGTSGFTYNASTKTITLANNANANGTWNITVTATDGAGRTTVRTLNTIVDRSIPVINDDIKIHDGDVVKDYDVNSWSRNGTLTVKGTINEAGSGLSIVYFMKGVANGVTNLKEITSEDRKSVGVLGIGSSVEYEFTVSDLAPGSTVVGIQTEDKAGNLSDIKRITLNLDKTNPSFGKTNDRYYSYEEALNYNQIEGTVLSNGTSDLYIVGPYSDTGSGVEELAFEIAKESGNTPANSTVKYSTGVIASGATNIGSMTWQNYADIADKTAIKSYRAQIDKDDFANGDGVVAKPLDRAGNGSTQTIFTIAIDDVAPVIRLNTPKTKRLLPTADAESVNTVNGTITFAGTTDETSMNRLELYYSTDNSTWVQTNLPESEKVRQAALSYNWSFNVPLSSVQSGTTVKFMDGSSYTGSPKDIFLKLVAVDKAGNTADYIYKYSVDPDGDRPIITFSQLDLTGLTENANTSNVWLTGTQTMIGSVIDDDGVTSLEYSLGGGAWTPLTVSNGNFTYNFPNETNYSMKFRVTDGAGNAFETKTGGVQYLAPKFKDKITEPEDRTINYSILNLKVDTNQPGISNIEFISNNGSADQSASDDFEGPWFGGDWVKFKLRFTATDSNGINITNSKVRFNNIDYPVTLVSGYYSTDYIALNTMDSGSVPITITVEDNAGYKKEESRSVWVDNKAPEVTISSPTSLVSMATQSTGAINDNHPIEDVYFMVTQHGVDPTTISTTATNGQNGANMWKKYVNENPGQSISAFSISFDNLTNPNSTNYLKWYLVGKNCSAGEQDQGYYGVGITTTDAINGTNGAERYTAITTVDIHIKAVDTYGNIGYATKAVTVDPQGDKPTVTITYPLPGSKLGGSIPIMGTAMDNKSADNVMVMIDMDGDNDWDRDDITALQTIKNNKPEANWIEWYKFDAVSTPHWSSVTYSTIQGLQDNTDWTKYGIKKEVSNASWNFTVNQLNELNPPSGTKNYSIWVYATDEDGNTSQIDLGDPDKTPKVTFTIDKDTPQIANEYLVQYQSGNSGAVKAKTAYSKDMSIKGLWWYEADIYDDTGISQVIRNTIRKNAQGEEEILATERLSAAGASTNNDWILEPITKGYHIKMKVGSDTANEVAYQDWKLIYQEIKDNSPSSGEREVALNVDNKAPVVVETGDYYNIRERVTNENGFYTFGTQAKEDPSASGVSQTGVKRIAFYFTRDIGTPHNIHALYDVMKAPSDDGNAISGNTSLPGINAAEGTVWTASDGTTLTKEDGLLWKTLTGSASGKTFTLDSADPDPNVHTGGLVKINGVIYRIDRVNGKTVSIEINTTATEPFSGVTSAKFAMANVVDNTTEETADETSSKEAGYYTNVNFDDGDIMVESLKKQSTTWTWEANINSKNIGDGSAQLHYVVFDAAGNYAEKVVNVSVANNQPRIAGVSIGTDTNGNGNVDSSEMISEGYSGIYAKGKQGNKNVTEAWFPSDKASSVLKILGKTRIVPEIVGGNGQLDYSYTVSESNGTGGWGVALINGSGTNIGTGNGNVEDPDAKALTIDLSMAKLLGMGNSTGSKFSLTVSDQTPGGALSATLHIIVDSLLQDTNPPKSRILPFYWVNGTKNSLFKESKDYGHIELPNDLPNTFTANGDGVNDRDPKLSGIVKIEGIAQDDVLLNTLTVNIGGEPYIIGTYDGEWDYGSHEWDKSSVPSNNWASLVTNATYREAYNMGFITAAEFNALDEAVKDSAMEFVSAKYGHIVHWNLYIDTSIIGNGANKVIMTSATDRGKASDAGNDTVSYAPNEWKEADEESHSVTANVSDSGTPTGYQKVDVVPYVTEVKRWTKFNTNRARSGAVSLLRGESNNMVSGFNLNTTTNTSISITSDKAGNEDPVAMESVDLSGSNLTFKVPTGAKSGYLQVIVNGVKALNNANAYVDYNTETNAKAFDHNTVTDDRYVHIWRVSQQDTFKGSKNAVYPSMARGTDGTLYAAFSNYGESKTYYTKSFIGNGTVAASKYTGTKNKWADDSIQTTNGANNGVATLFWGYDPPEEASIVVGPNDEVNVIYAANYHGGNDTAWSYFSSSDAGGLYIYDTHGGDTNIQSATKRAKIYRTELYTYDDELNQFKNARITRTTDYIYAVYYDRLTGAVKTCIINDSASGTDSRPNTRKVALPWITIDGGYDGLDNGTLTSGTMKFVDFESETNHGSFSTTTQNNRKGVTYNGTHYGFAPFTDSTYNGSAWIPFLNVNYENGLTRTSGTGESASITTNANGYPVVFYMDANTGCPRIARASSVYPNTTADWHVQGVFAESDENYNTASDYMSCKVDSAGYLHIAFQNTKGQLVYAKSKNNPADGSAYTFGASQVLDDSGMWIDLTLNGNTPYISYLSRVNSYDGMKIAFKNTNFDENNDGVAEGGWETMTAAMDAKVTNVRTCIAPNAKAFDGNTYTAAVGYCPGLDYRAAFYVGQ